jgi:hypothetical protein
VTERAPLQSKKFIAYLIAEILWKVILLWVLVDGLSEDRLDMISGAVAVTIILVAGFLEAGFILGQASLDKFVRVAQINASLLTPTKPPESEEKTE